MTVHDPKKSSTGAEPEESMEATRTNLEIPGVEEDEEEERTQQLDRAAILATQGLEEIPEEEEPTAAGDSTLPGTGSPASSRSR
jgi:hypothetical protein